MSRTDEGQRKANTALWARRDLVSYYATRDLRPPEVVILLRYRAAMEGRVLELGCGAGRLTGYLAEISNQVEAIDVSSTMVAECTRRYPSVAGRVGDLQDLSGFDSDAYDAVVAGYSVIDVLDDGERRRVLSEVRRIVSPNGVFIFSTHNRDAGPNSPMSEARESWREAAKVVLRFPRFIGNRRRLVPLQREEEGYAIFNDSSHDYGALHYYITRDKQEQQLTDAGFTLVECLDLDGHTVARGEKSDSGELHFIAR